MVLKFIYLTATKEKKESIIDVYSGIPKQTHTYVCFGVHIYIYIYIYMPVKYPVSVQGQ